MIERDMQTIFTKHIKTHLPKTTEVYELKICKGKSMPFNQVQPHQIKALLDAEEGDGFYHKLTDPPIFNGSATRFNAPRPFDCFALVLVKAYVVVWYYHRNQTKVFIKIPIKAFIKEQAESDRKSLTEERAVQIGKLIYV